MLVGGEGFIVTMYVGTYHFHLRLVVTVNLYLIYREALRHDYVQIEQMPVLSHLEIQ